MSYTITLQKIEHINHNVVRLITDKPLGYTFSPGQATHMAINKQGLKSKKRAFTFTSLPEEDTLEFIIKIYPSHNGVTEQIELLNTGDELIIEKPWGAITYQGDGTFIAGGSGITPFIAIFKDLQKKGKLQNNQLFFSNKTDDDIIFKDNLNAWLGSANLHLTVTDTKTTAYHNGYIDESFLTKHGIEITKPVYVCGPPEMMDTIKATLYKLGLPKSQLILES